MKSFLTGCLKSFIYVSKLFWISNSSLTPRIQSMTLYDGIRIFFSMILSTFAVSYRSTSLKNVLGFLASGIPLMCLKFIFIILIKSSLAFSMSFLICLTFSKSRGYANPLSLICCSCCFILSIYPKIFLMLYIGLSLSATLKPFFCFSLFFSTRPACKGSMYWVLRPPIEYQLGFSAETVSYSGLRFFLVAGESKSSLISS